MCKFAEMPFDELKAKCEDSRAPALELMIGRVILNIMKTGDYSGLESLLNRSVGKVKDSVDVSTRNNDEEFKKHPKENIIAILRQMNSSG